MGLSLGQQQRLCIARALAVHPEILLLVVGLNIWIGKWKGLRLVEYLRFSKIMNG